MKKTFMVTLLGAVLFAFGGQVVAQSYPNKPVKVIIPFPPGGATDIVGRAMAERLQNALGQTFIVENKPGASGNIGIGEATRAAPDGYTLVIGSPQTLTINHQIIKSTPFNPQRDLAPIVVIASVPNVLIVNNKLPVKNAQELIAYAKANPGKLSGGSSSIGGSPHLALESMKATYGLDIVHVPYKGSAPALQDLVGGQISMMFDNLPAALPLINGGQIKALGVTTLKRTASAPEIPTLDESGMKGFDSQGWFALLAPAGTPTPILDKINAEANKIINTPEFRERMTKVGADTVGGSIDEFKARIKSETERWGKVIQAADIKAE
jgi:tripartite-type tricarboxylate transporter receptor subunit TctC